MSRSAVVMVVAGAILLGVLAVVGLHYWPSLSVKGTVFKAVVLGLGLYGALLSTVMIRRIADPSLPVPILAWIVAVVWFIFGAIAVANRRHKDRELHGFDPRENKSETSSSFGKQGTGRGWAIFLTLVGLAMYATGLGLAWHTSRILEAPIETKPTVANGSAQPSDPKSVTPALPPDIVDQRNLAAAIAVAKPKLTDTRDAPSEGTKLLLRWAAARMRWADVAVAKNETSLEQVEKDPMPQVGKRLCIVGPLAKIEKQTVDGIEIHVARIAIANGDAIEIYAIGSTGTLVKRKPAKFCGVVTGRYDAGGPPATFAVGMFDTAKK
ncbi:MAG: hypothetical protein H0V17_14840 [Deltaproteobacteria bacterium]|nr:hypothetical protein [Deltaproteobacteria bacterium]